MVGMWAGEMVLGGGGGRRGMGCPSMPIAIGKLGGSVQGKPELSSGEGKDRAVCVCVCVGGGGITLHTKHIVNF